MANPKTALLLLSLALITLLAHSTMAAPTPDLSKHAFQRRGLLSNTLSLPAPHRRFSPETTANEAAVPNVSVRHDVEEVVKRALPPASSRPGSGSNYDKGKPYGRREDDVSEGV